MPNTVFIHESQIWNYLEETAELDIMGQWSFIATVLMDPDQCVYFEMGDLFIAIDYSAVECDYAITIDSTID